MDERKRKRLEAAGWAVGDTRDFLGLSEIEQSLIDLRLELAAAIRRLRQEAGLRQEELAGAIGSSQPRMAKVEAAGPGVSLDLMFRAFFAAGGKLADLRGETSAVVPTGARGTARKARV
jgi:DNA-binding XRE family transcriptional regulator